MLRGVFEGGRAEQLAKAAWEERGPEVSAGNGSVVYCAPLGAAYANRPERLLRLAPRMSALTHYDERFEEGLLRVMELGGDTDTNGAVAGGLLGAAVGTRGLPAEWLERLQDREAIQAEARSLADLAAVRPG